MRSSSMFGHTLQGRAFLALPYLRSHAFARGGCWRDLGVVRGWYRQGTSPCTSPPSPISRDTDAATNNNVSTAPTSFL